MDRKLIEAWEAIEKGEKLAEARKPKAKAPVKAPVKKKLDEEGVGGAYGAGVGPDSHAPTTGNTITKSGAAAVAPAKLGKKPEKRNLEEASPAIQSDAQRAAQQAISDVKSGKASTAQGALVGQIAEEDPLPPGADEIDPHAEGPEAAADAHLEDPAAEEANEDVTVDAETAEQVINAIQAQYPGAIITISVQVPEDTPFDTDLVASAQEVVGEPEADEVAGDAEVGGDEAEVGADSEIEGGEDAEPDKLMEQRKVVISKTRKQIKEMFARMKEEEPPKVDEVGPETEVAPEGETEVAPEVAEETPAIEPEIEVGDTKISLTPEQWGQVIGTADLLSVGATDAVEGGEDLSGELAPPADTVEGGEEVAPEELDELKMQTDDKGKLRAAVVGKEDMKKDKKTQVGIKQPVNESFNSELKEYASTLKKMMSE